MILFNDSTFILNAIIIVVLIFCIYRGYSKGMINQFFNIFTLVAAVAISWFLYVPFGKLFAITPKTLVPFQGSILDSFFYEKINSYIWFIILFIIAYIFLKFLKVIFNVIAQVPGISHINQFLGIFFGLINFTLISFLMIYLLSFPVFTNGVNLIEHSLLKPVVETSNLVIPNLAERLHEFEAFNTLVKDPKQASVEDVENMRKFLEKNNVSMENINKFIGELGKWEIFIKV